MSKQEPPTRESDGDDVRDDAHAPRVEGVPRLTREAAHGLVDIQALVEEEHADDGGDGGDGDREAVREREQYREDEQDDAERDEHGSSQLLVGEELLQEVVRGLDVAGLTDDHAVHRIDGKPTLDDGDDALVVRAIYDENRGVGLVALQERVHLLGDGAVRADDGLGVPRHDRDRRLLAVVPEVARDPQAFEQAVHRGVLGVRDAVLHDEGLHGLPAGDRGRDAGRSRHRARPVETEDQRVHSDT